MSERQAEFMGIAEDGKEKVFALEYEDGTQGMRRPGSVRNAKMIESNYKVDYIFKYFDDDEDSVLNYKEFRELVKFANEGQELLENEFECTCNAVGTTAKDGLNFEQFAKLYDAQLEEL